jgi:3-oxoacyl-[acyl-carrier protein] reductase
MDSLFIIGASSDIGRLLIRRMAKPGRTIYAHYHESLEKLELLRDEIEGDLVLLKADLADPLQVGELIESIRPREPQKILHLAAPRIRSNRFRQLEWSDFQHQLDVGLRSAVEILRILLPPMAKKKTGKVVLMLTSSTLNIPPAGFAHYITAKYALWGLTRVLASEYRKSGISINAVSPSMTETEFLRDLPDKMVELAAEGHPLKRNATPEDIAPVIEFLLSEGSDFMTGLNVPVSGGEVF